MIRCFAVRRSRVLYAVVVCALVECVAGVGQAIADEAALPSNATAILRRYCIDCHGNDLAEARINLQQLTSAPDVGRGFKDWEKVIQMLRQRKMPPQDEQQPANADRESTVAAIERSLDAYVATHAGDPGPVVIRRLTSAEYAYTIQDLTGLDLKLEKSFVSDASGGEGFTNVGGAQFMQDSTLQRYLEAAKTVADHAVIGAGPIEFFSDPGQTGRELSAIHRIQQIYHKHGFRTAAGEGAEPFGLDLYPRAFFVAWQYRHREPLGLVGKTLHQLARDEGCSERFCEHVWSTLNAQATMFPLKSIVASWQSLPRPGAEYSSAEEIRAACDELSRDLRAWQSTLAASAGDEEEASVLTAGEVRIDAEHSFTADINWPDDETTADFELSVTTASNQSARGALVVWRNARLRFRQTDLRRSGYEPLVSHLAPESLRLLDAGKHPTGAAIGKNDFAIRGETTIPVKLLVPPGTTSAQLFVDVELDVEHGADRIVRCRIADGEVEGETAAEVGDSSALLANPRSPAVADWKQGVAEFARLLPEVSQREPAPSDRDPIPPPFDNTYNMPERNHFHIAIKYHRDDSFLVQTMLDDATRQRLDHAWTDLLTSFEYHDANLRFVAKKFAIVLGDKGIADLDRDTIDRLPAEPRSFIKLLHDEYRTMQQSLRAAEPGHIEDVLRLAERAWRRPLTSDEQQRLREFYAGLRRDSELDHTQAIRALLTRIFVAPAFLYRAEPQREASVSRNETATVPLSDWELASRLSYFLWSSLPNEELRRAAAAGELRDPERLAQQARRMLRDPKARRLATEFFGQWFGFYRFDDYRGIDAGRFPEFTESLRAAMYDESISFFEHIVREDRPPAEILFADYTFLNAALAQHYGIDTADVPADRLVRVANVTSQHRGGLLGLAAVHAVTSAPLRTSAVKRGDWVLRRVIGTPVPPPPADAGSIAAEDVLADGLTVRKRLEAHRTEASCINCHSRIDPLGFALEHYDPIGRWRDEYRDGQPIDPNGTLSDGTEIAGIDGLRQYLRREQPQFERTLSEKLLGYALGRSEMASDRPLIEQMLADLKDDSRFSDLVVRIVTSKQFVYRRQ
jgi:hypothetical protein